VGSQDPLSRLGAVAGAVLGGVGFIYVVGALSLSLRYAAFGLPGQQAAAMTPREVLLAAGLRTLVIWVAIGAAIVLALTARDRWLASRIRELVRRRWVQVSLMAIAIALLFMRVLWPLAVLVAVLVATYATVSWDGLSVKRVLVTVLALGLVTVAYEADRISYYLEWTCVMTREPAGESCGVLVGQQDRGFYLGVPEGGRLLFVPAGRVASASSRRQLARAAQPARGDRREPIVSRLVDLRVR
jgi:hypothetical protein